MWKNAAVFYTEKQVLCFVLFSEINCNFNEMKNDLINTRNTKTIYMYFDSYYGKKKKKVSLCFQETICILLKILSKYLDISLLINIIGIYLFESWHVLSKYNPGHF